MSILTMFGTCHPFKGIYRQIQLNALASWARMKQEVILFGNEAGTAETCKRFGFRYVPKLERNEQGTPFIGPMFEAAESLATNNILCYCSADIILHGLVNAIKTVAKEFEQFLVIGRRWDAGDVGILEFGRDWYKKLKKGARPHSPAGVDYFGRTRGLWPTIPPFTLGYAYDNWLVDDALCRNIDVVDATEVVTAVHQKHPRRPRSGPQWEHNIKLFGNRRGRGTVNHATWVLGKEGLRKK